MVEKPNMPKQPNIPKQPDVVLILWQRNPLEPKSVPTITAFFINGDVMPCTRLLEAGKDLYPALGCLLFNNFEIVFKICLTDVSGLILLERK